MYGGGVWSEGNDSKMILLQKIISGCVIAAVTKLAKNTTCIKTSQIVCTMDNATQYFD